MEEIREWCSELGVMTDKVQIVACETKESTQASKGCWKRPISNCQDLVEIDENP